MEIMYSNLFIYLYEILDFVLARTKLYFYYEGVLKRDENEVKELKFFKLTEIPSYISPADYQ